jgi:hypothetical protein
MILPLASGLNDGPNFKLKARVKEHLDRCFKGFFYRALYTHGMTFADFIAGAFWPIIIIFGLLLRTVRAPNVRPLIVWSAIAAGFVYLVLWIVYRDTSLIAVADSILFLGGLGVGVVWFGCRKLYNSPPNPDVQLKASGMVLVGALLALSASTILFLDFALPRAVLEGRVQNVRIRGYRFPEHVADIAGRTVKVTTSVYERLKFLPVVRVEVSRGTNYIFKIEYLAN